MEYFIEQAKIALPVLGANIFRSPKATPVVPGSGVVDARADSPVFEMTLNKSGISTTAQEIDGEYTVLEGSGARLKWPGGEGHSYAALRGKLEQDRTLVPAPDDSAMQFTRNHVFASPSAAAAIAAGRSANGRVEWRVQGTRRTYGQWETEGVNEAMRPEVRSE